MAIVVPDVALEFMLTVLLKEVNAPSSVVYHWYTNDLDPDFDTVLLDFTEASGGTIASLTVSASSWGVDSDDGTATAEWSEQTVDVTTTISLYGYYVTDGGGGQLLWCERFDGAPFSYPSVGGALLITPRLELQSPIT